MTHSMPEGAALHEAAVRELVQSVLDTVAPGAEITGLGPEEDLRRMLDLDSLDFLNFVMGIDERTGRHTREEDYNRLATLAGCLAYLRSPA